uniref:Uncharacterized protein n=1 Tax=Trichuris muris TaxID=70415 RepID=A0A5S6R4C9_TRIMR
MPTISGPLPLAANRVFAQATVFCLKVRSTEGCRRWAHLRWALFARTKAALPRAAFFLLPPYLSTPPLPVTRPLGAPSRASTVAIGTGEQAYNKCRCKLARLSNIRSSSPDGMRPTSRVQQLAKYRPLSSSSR